MRRFYTTVIAACCAVGIASAQQATNDTLPTALPFTAVVLSQLSNAVVWGANRYVARQDFAYISSATVSKNIDTGFMWDNDLFGTNFVGHPYQGAIYFSSARAMGLSFGESLPYAIAGSLVWEICLENEPPSTNDYIVTPLAGAALGEVCHRLSHAAFRGESVGGERVARLVLSTLLSPADGVARLLEGNIFAPRRTLPATPSLQVVLTSSGKLAAMEGASPLWVGTLGAGVVYGDSDNWESSAPFSYFRGGIELQFGKSVPVIGEFSLTGLLWGIDASTSFDWGVFQHIAYYEVADDKTTYCQFTESVAYGLGGKIGHSSYSGNQGWRLSVYPSLTILGAVQSDYLNIKERGYSYGSGYSVRMRAEGWMLPLLRGSIELDYYQLYTWSGDNRELDVEEIDPLYADVMGDKGHTGLLRLSGEVLCNVWDAWSILCRASCYHRRAIYSYYPDVVRTVGELHIGVAYEF